MYICHMICVIHCVVACVATAPADHDSDCGTLHRAEGESTKESAGGCAFTNTRTGKCTVAVPQKGKLAGPCSVLLFNEQSSTLANRKRCTPINNN